MLSVAILLRVLGVPLAGMIGSLFVPVLWFHASLMNVVSVLDDILTSFQSFVIKFVLDSSGTMLTIIGIITALVIPLAIFIAEDVRDKNKSFSFERAMVFLKVLKLNQITVLTIVGCLLLLIGGPFVETCPPPLGLVLSLVIFVYGIIYFVEILSTCTRVFKWLADDNSSKNRIGYRQQVRIDYLNDLQDDQLIYDTWSEILTDGKWNIKNTTGFLEAYVDRCYQNDILDSKNSQNRSIFFEALLAQNLDNITIKNEGDFNALLDFGFHGISGYRKQVKEQVFERFFALDNDDEKTKDNREFFSRIYFCRLEEQLDSKEAIDNFIRRNQQFFLEQIQKNDIDIEAVVSGYPREWAIDANNNISDKTREDAVYKLYRVVEKNIAINKEIDTNNFRKDAEEGSSWQMVHDVLYFALPHTNKDLYLDLICLSKIVIMNPGLPARDVINEFLNLSKPQNLFSSFQEDSISDELSDIKAIRYSLIGTVLKDKDSIKNYISAINDFSNSEELTKLGRIKQALSMILENRDM